MPSICTWEAYSVDIGAVGCMQVIRSPGTGNTGMFEVRQHPLIAMLLLA